MKVRWRFVSGFRLAGVVSMGHWLQPLATPANGGFSDRVAGYDSQPVRLLACEGLHPKAKSKNSRNVIIFCPQLWAR